MEELQPAGWLKDGRTSKPSAALGAQQPHSLVADDCGVSDLHRAKQARSATCQMERHRLAKTYLEDHQEKFLHN